MLVKRHQSLLCYLLHISKDLDIIRMPVFTSKHCTGLNHAGVCCLNDYMYITLGHVFIFSQSSSPCSCLPHPSYVIQDLLYSRICKKGQKLRLWNSDYRRLHTLRLAWYIYVSTNISCRAFSTSRQMPFKSRSSRSKDGE